MEDKIVSFSGSPNGAGRRLKVVQIITRLIIGGAQHSVLQLCEGLYEAGVDLTLISGPGIGPEGSQEERARRGGYRFIVLPELRREVAPAADLVALAKLYGLLRELRPDIAHVHSAKGSILGRWAAWMAGVPRLYYTVHGLSFHEFQPRRDHLFFRSMEWLTGRITDRLLCVGEVMRQRVLKANLAPARRCEVLYLGLDVGRFEQSQYDRIAIRRRLGIPEGRVVIAKVARLAHLKGHDFLFDAFGRLQDLDVHLLLIGDGERRAELEARAREFGGRVTFAGLVPPAQVPPLLAAADIVAHTSLREGMPLACAEALLAGRPVVAFDIDGAREVVRDGETGFLIRRLDSVDVAEALRRLAKDAALRQAMGSRGRELCARQFDPGAYVQKVLELYRRAPGR